MLVKLIVTKGRTQNRTIELRSAETIVGRQSGCGLRIPASDVSRRHCRLVIQDGLLTVEDLQSVNGTFLNGVAVTSRRLARPGDELQIGPLTFVIDYPLHEAPRDKIFNKPAPPAQEGEALGEFELVEEEAEALDDVEVLDEVEEVAEAAVAADDGDTVQINPDDEPVVLEVDEEDARPTRPTRPPAPGQRGPYADLDE
jgi:predicted component of type VI protein secretion system